MATKKRPSKPPAQEPDIKALEEITEAEAQRIEGSAPILVPWPKARPRYLVTLRFREHPDEFECVSFTITSLRPGTSVSSAILRDLPVATLVREAVNEILNGRLRVVDDAIATPPTEMVHTQYGPDGPSVELVPPSEDYLSNREAFLAAQRDEVARRLGKATGRRYPPGHLEQVAAIVRETRRRKGSAQAAVAERFSISRSAAANQIARARRQGLLDTEED